jgi:hypothetical protein
LDTERAIRAFLDSITRVVRSSSRTMDATRPLHQATAPTDRLGILSGEPDLS